MPSLQGSDREFCASLTLSPGSHDRQRSLVRWARERLTLVSCSRDSVDVMDGGFCAAF